MATSSTETVSEQERWETEKQFRQRDITNTIRELDLKQREIEIKEADASRSSFRNPLIVAILVAAIAAAGNFVVAIVNGFQDRQLEAQRSEQTRILEMIKTGDPDLAAENLRFLLDAGLVETPSIVQNLSEFLQEREPGTGPTLASPSALTGRGGIVGVDDALPIDTFRGDHPVRQLARSVGRLDVSTASGRHLCTGFLTDGGWVVTVEHCVSHADGASISFLVDHDRTNPLIYDLDLSDTVTRGDRPGYRYRALRIIGAIDRRLRPLSIEERSPTVGAQLTTIIFRSDMNQWAIWESGDCRIVAVEDPLFHHLCDTGAGTSGSPVLMMDSLNVIGVHWGRGEFSGRAIRLEAFQQNP